MRVTAPIVMISSRPARLGLTAIIAAALTGCLDLKTTPDACSVTVAPSTVSIPVNSSTTLVGTAFDCKGNSIRYKKINYSSNNPAVATVTPEGQVIALAVGSASVSAVANGKSASVQVTVTPETVATITLNPSTITLRRTNTRQLTATALNSQNTVITGRTYQWASSNSAIASVDQNGMVSALSPGNVVISASSDQRVGSASIQVTEVPIGSCTLAPTTSTLTVTQNVQPTVTLRDTANNVISTLGRTLVWTSNNEIAATVTQSGLVTARRAGTAVITASPVENTQVSCTSTVNVVDARIVTANITSRSGSLRLGIPRQMVLALTDSVGGSINPAGRAVTWATVTPSTASVSVSGLVTGIALGPARIAVNAEGVVDTVAFNVTKIPVATVRLSPTSANVVQGSTVQFTPTVEDSLGNEVTDRVVEWTSSDNGRATVSNTGLVTTVVDGTVTIRAISEQREGSATVTIQRTPVATIDASDYTVALGATNKSFAIRLLDADGEQLFNRAVNIVSSDPSVATGTANALATVVTVSASKAGTTTFTLRALSANGQPEGTARVVTITITP